MLKDNTSYFIQFTQTTAKCVMRDPSNYIGKLITQTDSEGIQHNHLEFTHLQTNQTLKFHLHQAKPLPKVTIAFFDDKEPKVDTRVDMKCVAINQDRGRKRQRAVVELEEEQESSICGSSGSEGSEQQGAQTKMKGWGGSDEERNNMIKGIILKTLQETPSGNISPDQMRREVFRQGGQPTEKFVREYMESVCEISVERSNRKYILLEKYRSTADTKKRPKVGEE